VTEDIGNTSDPDQEKDQDQEGIPDIAQDQMPKTHRQL